MGIREEFDFLKYDLLIRLRDVTSVCSLDFPFDFKITPEEENKYLLKGWTVRITTKKAMIFIDNMYKKTRLLPSEKNAKMFSKYQDDILKEYRKKVLKDYKDQQAFIFQYNEAEFKEFIDKFIKDFKENSKPYIEKIKTLTQEEVNAEIEEQERVRNVATNGYGHLQKKH